MAQKISVINWKGGVGKTTFSHHIATGLHQITWQDRLPRVLLIDLDPQCNLSISCLSDDNFENAVYHDRYLTVKELLEQYFMTDSPRINFNDYIFMQSVRMCFDRNNQVVNYDIDLIASNPNLIYTDMDIAHLSRPNFKNNLLNNDIYKFKFLHNFVSQIEDSYDYIIMDCPPNLNFITQNAIYASDYYLIPTILDKLSTYGILSITEKVNELNRLFSAIDVNYVQTQLIGIVANMVIERSGEPKYSQGNRYVALQNTFEHLVFENYLTSGDGIATASSMGLPVYALTSSNAKKQAGLLIEITLEMLQRIQDGV